jgi:hypothetical protein
MSPSGPMTCMPPRFVVPRTNRFLPGSPNVLHPNHFTVHGPDGEHQLAVQLANTEAVQGTGARGRPCSPRATGRASLAAALPPSDAVVVRSRSPPNGPSTAVFPASGGYRTSQSAAHHHQRTASTSCFAASACRRQPSSGGTCYRDLQVRARRHSRSARSRAAH